MTTLEAKPSADAHLTREPEALWEMTTEQFLSVVGQRVRRHRTAQRMSRKVLAESSGVSERYLAQLEAGQGNMSIALLRKVARAIRLPLSELMAERSVRAMPPTVLAEPIGE